MEDGVWYDVLTGEMIYPQAMNMDEKSFMILQYKPE